METLGKLKGKWFAALLVWKSFSGDLIRGKVCKREGNQIESWQVF
jgi:hypothetical protein